MSRRLRLCRLEELNDPGSRGFEAGELGLPWPCFVVRRGTRAYGYRNSCPHTGVPLDWMPHRFLDLEEHFIQCSTHGALFRIDSGLCLRGPCLGQSLQPLSIGVADGEVFLEWGRERAVD